MGLTGYTHGLTEYTQGLTGYTHGLTGYTHGLTGNNVNGFVSVVWDLPATSASPTLQDVLSSRARRVHTTATLVRSFSSSAQPFNTHTRKEGERDREGKGDTERETDRQTQTEAERERETDRDRDRQTDGQRQRDREHIAHKHSSLNHGDLDFLISRHPLQVGGIESAEEVSHRHVHVPVCHDPLP